jgi:hypothetical protein
MRGRLELEFWATYKTLKSLSINAMVRQINEIATQIKRPHEAGLAMALNCGRLPCAPTSGNTAKIMAVNNASIKEY